jgi:cell division protease FtsH
LVEAAHDEAYQALNLNRKVLDTLAKELMERETLNQDDLALIFKNIKKMPMRAQWLSKKSRPVSKQGPIAIPVKNSTAEKRANIAKAEAAAKGAVKPKRAPAKKAAAKPTEKAAGTETPSKS